MTVRDRAAHKPDAPAKERALRWRVRLVCCRILHTDLGIMIRGTALRPGRAHSRKRGRSADRNACRTHARFRQMLARPADCDGTADRTSWRRKRRPRRRCGPAAEYG